MRELIDALVRSAGREGMELYGVHLYRRGAEPAERRLRSDDRVNLRSVSKTFTSERTRRDSELSRRFPATGLAWKQIENSWRTSPCRPVSPEGQQGPSAMHALDG